MLLLASRLLSGEEKMLAEFQWRRNGVLWCVSLIPWLWIWWIGDLPRGRHILWIVIVIGCDVLDVKSHFAVAAVVLMSSM